MSAAYPLTVIEENGARAGPTGFVENVHAMIRVVAEDPGVREVELTVVLTRDIAARPGRSPLPTSWARPTAMPSPACRRVRTASGSRALGSFSSTVCPSCTSASAHIRTTSDGSVDDEVGVPPWRICAAFQLPLLTEAAAQTLAGWTQMDLFLDRRDTLKLALGAPLILAAERMLGGTARRLNRATKGL